MSVKSKIFEILINILLFWVVTDLFTGITINDGILGYVVSGGIFGILMAIVVPLIKFLTIPMKLVITVIASITLSLGVFFVMYIGIPYIGFADGSIAGLSNRYFEVSVINLSMMGGLVTCSIICGLLSALIKFLKKS